MASKREEVTNDVKTLGTSITEVKSNAAQAKEEVQALVDLAAEHGWDGVAATVQQAVDALGSADEELVVGEGACEEAVGELDQITDKMSSPEVEGHLDKTVDGVDTAGAALNAATEHIQTALEACQRAGEPEGVLQTLQLLHDAAEKVSDQVKNLRATVEAERVEADTFGKPSS